MFPPASPQACGSRTGRSAGFQVTPTRPGAGAGAGRGGAADARPPEAVPDGVRTGAEGDLKKCLGKA